MRTFLPLAILTFVTAVNASVIVFGGPRLSALATVAAGVLALLALAHSDRARYS